MILVHPCPFLYNYLKHKLIGKIESVFLGSFSGFLSVEKSRKYSKY